VKRWVFPQLCDGLRAIAHDIMAPRHYLKLCGSDEELRSAMPARWEVQLANYFMMAAAAIPDTKPLPNGYRMEFHQAGPVTRACIIAPDGCLAASGCAAETADVFIYDRIETALLTSALFERELRRQSKGRSKADFWPFQFDVFAPFGLEDIFAMVIRPNYALPNRETHERKAARAKSVWPEAPHSLFRWARPKKISGQCSTPFAICLPRFSASILQNSAPCSMASSRATWVWACESNQCLGMPRLVLLR
jgi:hypothetical protein